MYIGKALVKCVYYERALALDIKFHFGFNIKFNIDRMHQTGIPVGPCTPTRWKRDNSSTINVTHSLPI